MIKFLTKKTFVKAGVIIYKQSGVVKMDFVRNTMIDPSTYDGGIAVLLLEV